MVGRLFGIVTTTPDGATGPLNGMSAVAFGTLAALAFALAAAVLVVVAFVIYRAFAPAASAVA
jgi:hypothetical protein